MAAQSDEGTRVLQRDATRTRQAILDSATVEFTAHGYGGASVNDVAARAAINKRMIYHYFGNKEGLWIAVLEAAYARIRAAEQALELDHLPPLDAVRRLVVFTFDYFVANPEFISLLNSENMLKAHNLAKSEHVRQMHSPMISLLSGVLERGAAEGVFRKGLDPVDVYVSLAGLCYFYLANQHTLGVIFGRSLGTDEALAARRRHVEEFTLSALRPAPA